MTKKNTLTTPSVLSFERKFDISDAIFFQQDNKGTLTPILVTEKSVKTTISNRLKNKITADPVKLDAEIEKANLQKVDVAMLDNDKEIAIVQWTCKVLPFTGEPNVCNNLDYQTKLTETIKEYIDHQGFGELAHRYATNILNGRWLWRNRMAAQSIEIEVELKGAKSVDKINVSDAKSYSLNEFSTKDEHINKLATWIEAGLSGDEFVIFTVTAKLQMGYGQEVYPSQELILDASKRKSKILYEKNGQTGMHSQKIGNALRSIDTWYEDDAKFPIAIEPYGSVTTMGHAFRQPKLKNDFYTLFDNWILKSELPPVEQQHYVLAILLRGGIFGASGKE